MTQTEKVIDRILALGPYLLVASFRNQETVLKVISQLPYVELNPPYVSPRKGTDCQAIGNVRLKDGSRGFFLITGGNLTPSEAETAKNLLITYGEDQMFTVPQK